MCGKFQKPFIHSVNTMNNDFWVEISKSDFDMDIQGFIRSGLEMDFLNSKDNMFSWGIDSRSGRALLKMAVLGADEEIKYFRRGYSSLSWAFDYIKGKGGS